MTKKKPKTTADDIDVRVTKMEYPIYVNGYVIYVDIDLTDHIDWYSYHDAPSSVGFELTIEELRTIKGKIDKAILDAERIVAENT
jgi:hypothetical protein